MARVFVFGLAVCVRPPAGQAYQEGMMCLAVPRTSLPHVADSNCVSCVYIAIRLASAASTALVTVLVCVSA